MGEDRSGKQIKPTADFNFTDRSPLATHVPSTQSVARVAGEQGGAQRRGAAWLGDPPQGVGPLLGPWTRPHRPCPGSPAPLLSLPVHDAETFSPHPRADGVKPGSDFTPAGERSRLQPDVLGTPDSQGQGQGQAAGGVGRQPMFLGGSLDFGSLLLTHFLTALVFLAHDFVERQHFPGRTRGVTAASPCSVPYRSNVDLRGGPCARSAHAAVSEPAGSERARRQ